MYTLKGNLKAHLSDFKLLQHSVDYLSVFVPGFFFFQNGVEMLLSWLTYNCRVAGWNSRILVQTMIELALIALANVSMSNF